MIIYFYAKELERSTDYSFLLLKAYLSISALRYNDVFTILIISGPKIRWQGSLCNHHRRRNRQRIRSLLCWDMLLDSSEALGKLAAYLPN